MKNPITKLTVAASMLVLFMQPLAAQPQKELGKRGPGDPKMKAELNLSEAQEKQMQDLRFKHEKEMIGLRAELETRELAMKELRGVEPPNKKKLYAQIDQISETKTKIAKAKLDHRLAVQEILTPEQQKLFKQNAMHRKGRKAERDGCFGDEHGPRKGMGRK